MTVVQLPARFTIGGSDAAAAAGVDPHKSRVMLWLEKTGRHQRDETEAMRWGTLLQPTIIAELNERGIHAVQAEPTVGRAAEYADKARPWLVGHPDGYVLDVESEDLQLLEVKTVGQWGKREWNGKPPLAYVAQVQHYLHLTGLDRGLLAVLVGGQRLETYAIVRHQSAIDKLLKREEQFYGFLVRDEPPPPDSSESAREAVAAMFPEHVPGRVMRLDKRNWANLRELRARREQRDTIDAQVRGLENELKAAMGDAETAISPHDDPVLRWKAHTMSRTDVKRLRKKYPEIADECVTMTHFRRFDVL